MQHHENPARHLRQHVLESGLPEVLQPWLAAIRAKWPQARAARQDDESGGGWWDVIIDGVAVAELCEQREPVTWSVCLPVPRISGPDAMVKVLVERMPAPALAPPPPPPPLSLVDLHTRLRALHSTLVDIRKSFGAHAGSSWPLIRASAFADAAESALWTSVCTLAAEMDKAGAS